MSGTLLEPVVQNVVRVVRRRPQAVLYGLVNVVVAGRPQDEELGLFETRKADFFAVDAFAAGEAVLDPQNVVVGRELRHSDVQHFVLVKLLVRLVLVKRNDHVGDVHDHVVVVGGLRERLREMGRRLGTRLDVHRLESLRVRIDSGVC